MSRKENDLISITNYKTIKGKFTFECKWRANKKTVTFNIL